MEFRIFNSRRTAKFQSVAIIETDLHFQNTMSEYCSDFEMEEIARFTTCEEAWQDIQEGKFDLVIIDWFTKGALSPIGLFNRIKNSNLSVFTPIIVTSGYVERHDFRLLREFPLVALIEKPFTSGVMYQAFEHLQTEYTWYIANMKKLNKILNGPHPHKALKRHMSFILNKSPNPGPLAAMYGKVLRIKGYLKEAEEVLRWSIGVDPDHVALLNEIGKLYHIKGKHRESLKYLRRAGSLSPDNTKRLCLIGELELGERKVKEARKSFSDAMTLDPHYIRAVEGVKLTSAAESYLAENLGDTSTNSSFASLMNTIGINKVRSGRLNDGIKHYKSALNFIDDSHTKSKVMFNIALGFLRHNNIKESLLWFMRASKSGGLHKADKYVDKLTGVFVLTDDKQGAQANLEVRVVDESQPKPKGDERLDDLDDLHYDDFHDENEDLSYQEAGDDDLLDVIGEESLVG